MDELQSLRHNLHLRAANRTLKGVNLPVRVRHADTIEIDEHNLAHAAPRERFGCEGANSAHAHDEYTRRREAFESSFREESSGSVEAAPKPGFGSYFRSFGRESWRRAEGSRNFHARRCHVDGLPIPSYGQLHER